MIDAVSTVARDASDAASSRVPFWRRLLARVLEGRRRKADQVILEHLRHHRPDTAFQVELERRLMGQ